MLLQESTRACLLRASSLEDELADNSQDVLPVVPQPRILRRQLHGNYVLQESTSACLLQVSSLEVNLYLVFGWTRVALVPIDWLAEVKGARFQKTLRIAFQPVDYPYSSAMGERSPGYQLHYKDA